METNMNNRIEYIDALRGMTMILVVYSHIAYWCMDDVSMGYNVVFIKFRMPTFFFISGWVFFKVKRIWDTKTISDILKKKFMVQIIPFLFFMSLYINLFNGPEYHSSFEDKYGYWFTFSLFEYFVIYIAAEAVFNKRSTNKDEIIVFLILLTLSLLAFYYEHIWCKLDLGIWKPILTVLSFSKIKYIFFFWFGAFAKKNFDLFVRLTDNQYLMTAFIGVLLILLLFPIDYVYMGLDYIDFLFSGITGTIVLFTFFRKKEQFFSKNKKIGSCLQYIGKRTLDIYLLHYFFLPYHLTLISDWLSRYSHKTLDVFVILLMTLWVVAISLLISNIIRMSPFLGHYLFGAKKIME